MPLRRSEAAPEVRSLLNLAWHCFIATGFIFAVVCSRGAHAQTVARQWNDALLEAIRIDFPAPTVHSRNLYHTSAAMYDAWAAYDPVAGGHFYEAKHSPGGIGVAAARDEAISFAAYRVLSERYQLAVDPSGTQLIFDDLMNQLGYDPTFTSTDGTSPAAIGNRIATQILDASLNDGSNELNGYTDPTGYQPTNVPMVVDYPGLVTPDAANFASPNRWQPLYLDSARTQNDLVGENLQVYVGPHWGDVTTFALGKDNAPGEKHWASVDPGPPPQLGGAGDQQYRDDTMLLLRYSHSLDPSQGPGAELINISPSVNGNRPLGTHNNQGYEINPVTNQPYADNLVLAADYGRILAEFWADGPKSETPPGHWNVLANEVSDSNALNKRIGGTGVAVSDLEWDVKLYLALNGGLHDAAIAAWGIKREYDYVRPITKIRYQGSLGQSTNPSGVAYHPDGLPLEAGLVEQVTAESIAVGGRHRNAIENANLDNSGNTAQNFTEAQMIGKIVVNAWNHEPEDPTTQVSGIDWILAENWVPYQADNFVTPAFAAYISGHSTFSRAAAEVLTKFTGSEYFPGGLGEQVFTTDYLDFENGPTQDVTLQWATYFDAADEAGISRLWGGIHVPVDDFAGRIIGSEIGRGAYDFALGEFVWSELQWCNLVLTADVNNDGVVMTDDAEVIRDELNARVFSDANSFSLQTPNGVPPAFLDTTNDGYVAPLDLLLVINELQAMRAAASGPVAAMAVPEPTSTMLTIAFCMQAVALLRRTRIRRSGRS